MKTVAVAFRSIVRLVREPSAANGMFFLQCNGIVKALFSSSVVGENHARDGRSVLNKHKKRLCLNAFNI